MVINMESKEVKKIKKKYNTLLKRYKKAGEYLQNENISLEERLRYVGPEEDPKNPKKLFNKVVRELSKLIFEYEIETNKQMSESEMLNGFND